ncbi:ABC transporter permease [Xylanibacter rodentium]|nr:ABC transporter permease [Xylanibacter rodentium]
MSCREYIQRVKEVALRECAILKSTPIYWFCMVVFPMLTMIFFTSLMHEGQPQDMPVGIVDLDNTSTSRKLTRNLDAFQTSRVVARYTSVSEARTAIQRNEIYAFLYIPKGTTDKMLASRQPKISFYYSLTSLTSGALLFRDLKTISTLGGAAVGQATMTARGYTPEQIRTFLQPITIDLHQISNPWTNYNIYLSTMLVPGVIMLFIMLITVYSIGTELKFGRSRRWIQTAGSNIAVALAGKMLPQTLIFLSITYGYMYYVFGILDFPHPGGTSNILLLGLLSVLAPQGFGLFIFGLMPSLRLSMSTCSLWAVLSFSMAGSAFPIMAMDAPLQSLSWLFPMHHYFMIYQITIFNAFPLADAWLHAVALIAFAMLPVTVLEKLKNAMINYVYIP